MAAPAWEIDDAEVRETLSLPREARYASFVQLAADWEETWGLKDDNGWIVRGSDSDQEAFPLWPHPTFARLCARAAWEGAVPERISVDELLDDLLPLLEEDAIAVEVFPTPDAPGTVTAAEELRRELQRELDLGE